MSKVSAVGSLAANKNTVIVGTQNNNLLVKVKLEDKFSTKNLWHNSMSFTKKLLELMLLLEVILIQAVGFMLIN